MKKVMKFVLPICVFAAVIMYSVSCNTAGGKVALDVAAKPFEKLSEYNFFTGVINQLKPNLRVIPYDLITPLFTDYAHKARFVYVPEGKTTDYDTSQVLQFPVGSCLIKNFYYPADFNKPEGDRRIMETRLLVHREDGWEALDYIWNDEQTDAQLENAGDIKHVSWVHYDGTKRELDYVIPNKNQCKGCHWVGNVIQPIGPKVRNLNRDFEYADGKQNQLTYLTKAGFLKGTPSPENAPKLADWTDSTHYTVEERSRAYLEMNCGHCHNPKGPAYTSGLLLNIGNTNPENLGVCKTPVAAGKATGSRLYDIVPGHPELSILSYRIESENPGIKMPEVGKVLVHKEGVELLNRWISEMKASGCETIN
jgi:uncharacterized repeat protein (TIGR03806 family)